ncbi:MAG: winged helix-turn-helix domain-containing protein [Acidobacteriia bacterium]|nr:winged helix-turn-helix domain-containing protein [Terriglobia bacterium]
MQVPAQDRQSCRFGPFTVDLVSREVWNGGKIQLQEKPFQILAILLERPGQLVTREELQHRLWPAGTFVDFDHSINTAIKKLREALGDDAEQPRFIETLPRRGYRFIGQLEETIEQEKGSVSDTKTDAPQTLQTRLRRRWYMPLAVTIMAGILLLVGLNLAGVRDRWLHGTITEHDTILLADFVNKTGDPVFDDALKQALAAELGQSPFLNLVSQRKVIATLRMMGRSADEPITMDVARELCQRTGSKAALDGTISSLGTHYLINLDAVACATGDSLAKEEAEAASKEDVLKALDRASSSLRSKLGESLPSVQKFDVPFEATTSSLEALKNYSLGIKVKYEKGDAQSIPFLKRAIELDPNFASAYSVLAIGCTNAGQQSLALEYATKAYQLRDRVTEREKQGISATYFHATGEVEKVAQTYQVWKENYPRDFVPYGNLGVVYNAMGLYDKALLEFQEAGRLRPDNVINYGNLASAYIFLNRLDEAKATLDEALAHKLDGENLRSWIYTLAFLRRDVAQMEQQLAWGAGRPGDEEGLLSAQSDTEAYYGRLSKARDFTRRAVELSVRGDSREAAALFQIDAALRDAEIGNTASAKKGVKAALAFSSGRDIKVVAALALARSGDAASAKALIEELEKKYPAHTFLKLYWLPTIKASLELHRGKPSQAIADLQPATPYELGQAGLGFNSIYPAYVRGQAYLKARNSVAALAEFQKMLDHRSIVQNSVIGSLAFLQIARAYAVAGNTARAKAAYEDFFALWKDADPEIPILKESKTEYAKLQ